jgi:hypothetical protein
VSLPDSETETEVPAGQTQIGEAVQALTKTLGTESFVRDGRLPEHVDDFQLLRLQFVHCDMACGQRTQQHARDV